MKPAEEILKNIIDDNMEKFQQTFGDTFKMKVQDVTGQITPDIVANLIKEPDAEKVELESEDTDGIE